MFPEHRLIICKVEGWNKCFLLLILMCSQVGSAMNDDFYPPIVEEEDHQ